MNKKKIKLEQKWLIAAALVVVLSATTVITGISGTTLQKTFAENYSVGTISTPSVSNATTFKAVDPNQSTNKEFWIQYTLMV